MSSPPSFERCYPADVEIVHWRGQRLLHCEEFDLFLRGPVRARIGDIEFETSFAEDMAALATTDMASETLTKILSSSPPPLDWEVGEALAECLLSTEFEVRWPWNENRDRKTPKASLPGADLVGFLGEGEETVFLFGEVKSSSDAKSPPGVMNGRSGMTHQIDRLVERLDVNAALMKWLFARCKNNEFSPLFQAAAKRYLESQGRDITFVGVLLRDTEPAEKDLQSRAAQFVKYAAGRPSVRLDAWYLPRRVDTLVGTMLSNGS